MFNQRSIAQLSYTRFLSPLLMKLSSSLTFTSRLFPPLQRTSCPNHNAIGPPARWANSLDAICTTLTHVLWLISNEIEAELRHRKMSKNRRVGHSFFPFFSFHHDHIYVYPSSRMWIDAYLIAGSLQSSFSVQVLQKYPSPRLVSCAHGRWDTSSCLRLLLTLPS